ncbi:hypothetical protein GLOTRDRAFT_116236 [Gloeophyllum trabeum ATCC 11539]|uniref:Mid2 domain-containing protein n=1 Tax=Gloeophyllum trabeum (strain ATCC 11539 / FP-39264 / Madison 617) TaxID=670483 RepID=S7Q6Z5_GLOTA|nr:uncharacterized protein GLOTRDRAFT_116236 [Gloeophyllum trabeum ATCC 11539]EPQ55292.1 hypothetical protein GLOTRDRAFT_116236 [Gloeophyllum trabeum ATCC 11539]
MRALLAVVLLPLFVVAQSASPSYTASVTWSTFAVGGGIAAIPITTAVPVAPATRTECWAYETLQDSVASVSLDPGDAVPSNAICWQVYSTGGGIMRVPLTPALVSLATVIPVASSSAMSSSNASSRDRLRIILGAVLGSVAGVVLITMFTIYLIRRKSCRAAEEKRAWVQRPGGWVPDVEHSQMSGPVSINLVKPEE